MFFKVNSARYRQLQKQHLVDLIELAAESSTMGHKTFVTE